MSSRSDARATSFAGTSQELCVVLVDELTADTVATIAANLEPGWTCLSLPALGEPERASVLSKADVLLVTGSPIDRLLIEMAPRLRVVHKLGAGIDRVDIAACRDHGVAVFRLQGGNAHVVAEHTIMLILATLRHLPLLDRETRAGNWLKEAARGMNRQLSGKHVGLVGFGAIGQAVARRLTGFNVEVSYHDARPLSVADETNLRARWLPLGELVERADIISLHLPLTAETWHLFDTARIGAMKRGAILVNAARGGLVDEQALTSALRSGHLAGAALDTFETEPPVDSVLLAMPEIVVTPHAAGVATDNVAQLIVRARANICGYLAGEQVPPGDIVLDPRVIGGRGDD